MDRETRKEMNVTTPDEKRFAASVAVDRETGCWKWKAGFRNGRPLFYSNELGQQVYAARWAYSRWTGPIKAGERLKTVCKGGRLCVNPTGAHHIVGVVLKDFISEGGGLAKYGFPGLTMNDLTPEEQELVLQKAEKDFENDAG